MCVYHLLELELDKEKKQSRWTKLKGKKKIFSFSYFPRTSMLRFTVYYFDISLFCSNISNFHESTMK